MSMSTTEVDIGYLEEKSGWLLHPRFYPSKVGGKPSWLDLKNLPHVEELLCKKCQNPMVFLCQIYAPYEELEQCFHRTIFLFICKNGPCCQINNSDNFLVLRCQLPRKNDFYSFEPYKENDNEEFPMEKWPNLCEVCGIRTHLHCSKCKKTFYCTRKHQVLDWHKKHKPECSKIQLPNKQSFIVTESGKTLLFKEWEIIIDEEDQEEANEPDENLEMEKFKNMVEDKKAGTLSNISESELNQYNQTIPEDKVFNKFKKRIARHPGQVIRYDKGGSPLWITTNSDNLLHIPNCQYCNGERQFEFQVMPQLLNYIDVGTNLNSIDWGILAVYTCKASCNVGPSYKIECLIKQDL